MRREWAIALFLFLVTLALYWPVRQFDLIYFDDPIMLTECPPVQAGLTWASVKWCFTGVVAANWNPVTSFSYLVVSEFYGIAPGPHHLVNAICHALNAGLLFWVLWRLTGATWRSAVVAAIFAWHPQRVESVAWIIERKDVVCGFFFLLALWFYAGFARMQTPGQNQTGLARKQNWFYAASLLAFGLALLSKPMAVTLPFVLLLLDVWPLQRFPLSACCLKTTKARFATGVVSSPNPLIPAFSPIGGEGVRRTDEGAAHTSVQPANAFLLAIPAFGFPRFKQLILEKWPFFLLMVVGSVATFYLQRNGTATTSWEVLGLNARVANALAGYVAYLGQLFWPVDFAAIYPYPQSFDPVPTGLKAVLLLALTAGCVLQIKRRPQLAVGWFWYLGMAVPVIGIVQVGEQAMADRYTYLPVIGPVVALVWTLTELLAERRGGKLALLLLTPLVLAGLWLLSERQLQFWRNTISLFEHNIVVTPENASAHFTLGLGFEHAGDTNRAMTCYRVAKTLSPFAQDPRRNLASLLMKQGHFATAENEYGELVERWPDNFTYRLCLAEVLARQGRDAESFEEINEAVRLNPDSAEALNNLAWVLVTTPHAELRDAQRAIISAQRACELTQFSKTMFIGTLGAAYAEAGRFDDAMNTTQKACDLAAKNGEVNLLQRNRQLLDRYRSHRTARDP